MSLYMMCVYGDTPHSDWFRKAWAETGKKLDMGKACIRFKKGEDLALDVIAEAIRRVPAKKYIDHCEAAHQATRKPASKGRVETADTSASLAKREPRPSRRKVSPGK
jgi:hypothetical protein